MRAARPLHHQRRPQQQLHPRADIIRIQQQLQTVYLARRPGKVINHRTLLGAIWGSQSTEQVEYLRVFVGQLRKKLEPDASSPRYIVTEPWVGYRFEPGE